MCKYCRDSNLKPEDKIYKGVQTLRFPRTSVIYLKDCDLIFKMMIILKIVYMLPILVSSLFSGNVQQNNPLPFKITVNNTVQNAYLVLDANWHWVHSKSNSNENCYTSSWNPSLCPDPVTCSSNCAIEGIPNSQWINPYGVSVTNQSSLTLRYVTNGQYGQNIGSRLYLLDQTQNNYYGFNLKNRQFTFTVDVSQLPCGLNGALYFVEMPLNGGNNLVNGKPPQFGLSYGDSQCTNIKFINGWANTNSSGACSNEMDIWEANSRATQMTPHVCKYPGVTPCTNPVDCGTGSYRYNGECDMDGADYNPYRLGNKNLYGPGSNYAVDTTKPFDVITQFITVDGTDSGNLYMINRIYSQNGKTINGGNMTDSSIAKQKAAFNEVNYFHTLGGMTAVGNSLSRKMVLVLSLWDDSASNMLWLDSNYPVGSTSPGASRGPCPTTGQDPNTLRSTYPNSEVIYSNIRIDPITTPPPTPTPTPPPTPPSGCSIAYGQCGGIGFTGSTCCVSGYSCVYSNNYYSQCIPGNNPTPVSYWNCGVCQYTTFWSCQNCTFI